MQSRRMLGFSTVGEHSLMFLLLLCFCHRLCLSIP